MSSPVSDAIIRAWYQGSAWIYLLFPFTLIYWVVITLRKWGFQRGLFSQYRSKLPVVVVGNITVGGTGKSPLVCYLVDELRALGFSPGIVSRGYGAEIGKDEVREALATSLAKEVGDEPLMLKKRLSCPVVVGPSRKLAVQKLESLDCDIVISDDGLQHYAMARDLELCVFDGSRGLGNGQLIPTGPLRESATRVSSVDFCIVNGGNWRPECGPESAFRMNLVPDSLKPAGASSTGVIPKQQHVHAVAAIGNPERFFLTLEQQGFHLSRHAFPDHHAFSAEDLRFQEELPVIMTEKDAVKCSQLALNNAWYLPVKAELNADLASAVVKSLKQKGYLNG